MGISVGQLKQAVQRLLLRTQDVADVAAAAISEVNSTKADKMQLHALNIPAEGWKNDGVAGCPYYLDLQMSGLTENDCVAVIMAPAGVETATKAGLTATESRAGILRLRAQKAPTATIPAAYYIVK